MDQPILGCWLKLFKGLVQEVQEHIAQIYLPSCEQ